MNKIEFLGLVEDQLRDIFKQKQLGSRDDKDKYRCEGFMQCGRLMGIVEDRELNELMETTHQEVFNMSIAERRAKKLELTDRRNSKDPKKLESPSFLLKQWSNFNNSPKT